MRAGEPALFLCVHFAASIFLVVRGTFFLTARPGRGIFASFANRSFYAFLCSRALEPCGFPRRNPTFRPFHPTFWPRNRTFWTRTITIWLRNPTNWLQKIKTCILKMFTLKNAACPNCGIWAIRRRRPGCRERSRLRRLRPCGLPSLTRGVWGRCPHRPQQGASLLQPRKAEGNRRQAPTLRPSSARPACTAPASRGRRPAFQRNESTALFLSFGFPEGWSRRSSAFRCAPLRRTPASIQVARLPPAKGCAPCNPGKRKERPACRRPS